MIISQAKTKITIIIYIIVFIIDNRKLFIPKYKQAINNAKIVYQTKIKDQKMLHNGNIKEWEMCSSTTVFMLVEALKL